MLYLRLLADPRVFCLWIGQLLSVLGDRLYIMTVLWLVMQTTGSTELMSVVAVAQLLPLAAAGLFSGALVDRMDRFTVMIVTDLVRAVLAGLVPLAYLAGHFSPALLVAVGAGLGLLGSVFVPALQAVLPDLAQSRGASLPALIGLMDTTDRLGRVLGPGAAGLLLLVMPQIHLLTINAVSFVVSGATLAWVAHRWRDRERPARQARRSRLGREVLEGLRLAARERVVLFGLVVRGWGNFAWSIYTLGLPLLLTRELHSNLGWYGIALAAYGVGTLVGNVFAGHLDLVRHILPVFCWGWTVVGFGLALTGLVPRLSFVLAGTLLTGLAVPFANITMDVYIGRHMAGEVLGRIYSLQRINRDGANGLGLLAAGFLLACAPVGAAIVWAGVSVAAVAVAAYVFVHLRTRAGRTLGAGTGGSSQARSASRQP
jgi:MFS family permease